LVLLIYFKIPKPKSKPKTLIKVLDICWLPCRVLVHTPHKTMGDKSGWVTANKACELLGLDKKALFRMRDNGVLRLGPHYAAFNDTFSRDSYRWNVTKVRKTLQKLEKSTEVVV
jgi:hypothetical protein